MKDMWQEARSNVLRKELDDAILRLSGLGDEVKVRASLAMADAFHKLTQRPVSLANVSNEGKKKIAAQLNDEGKRSFDFDMGHAYGLALLSMMIEAEALPGADAMYVQRITREMLQAALQAYEGGTDKSKDEADVAIETAVILLQVQIALGNTEENDEFNERLKDSYSRGYIFGLCDALLQSAGVNNDGKAVGVITIVHLKLFGEDSGATIVGQSLRDQEVELFIKGRMRGGQELIEFFTNKTPPMGLAGYLLNGEM